MEGEEELEEYRNQGWIAEEGKQEGKEEEKEEKRERRVLEWNK